MASNECTETDKRQQFGNRFLTDPENVFQHNAWDNVVWDQAQEDEAKQKTEQQLAEALPEEDREMYEDKASHFWDEFYNIHTNRFFKDRHWLFVEFPELYSTNQTSDSLDCKSCESSMDTESSQTFTECITRLNMRENVEESSQLQGTVECTKSACESEANTESTGRDESFPGEKAKFRILEVGCGVGNTIFPVLQTNNDPDLMVYGCDFSSSAIQIVQEHTDYNPQRCHAFVCDVSDGSLILPMPNGTLDLIIMIFVLSAINPSKMQFVIDRLARLLKPGGQILFRDYGRYDLAQLRFKKGRCLSENFYVRGDGTRVYFFTQDELKDMFTKSGLVEKQNLLDRRLQVNRGKQLKMYRVWIQCKYQKPLDSQHTEPL